MDAERLKLLSFTICYPNPVDPVLGNFVRFRVRQIATMADVRVIAPVERFRFSKFPRFWANTRDIPGHIDDDGLQVLHPRWTYPPLAGTINSVFLFLQLLGPIARLRRQFDFQLIDAHFGHPEGVAAALLSVWFRRQFIITLRGSEVDHAQRPIRRWAMSWALRRAARVITVSERLRKFAISLGIDPQRTRTIPNGVDSHIYHPRDIAACRQKHGIPHDRRVILSAGVLMPLKGQHLMVRALKRLAEGGIRAELILAGYAGRTATYEQELRSEIAALGLEQDVRLPGHLPREELAELTCAADVFCLASTREGWPNVVHEALACGTPVVATDVGAIPEMMPSESPGFVVPPNDVPALAEALARALRCEWDRQAIARWGQARSWENVAADVFVEMQQVIRESARK